MERQDLVAAQRFPTAHDYHWNNSHLKVFHVQIEKWRSLYQARRIEILGQSRCTVDEAEEGLGGNQILLQVSGFEINIPNGSSKMV